MKQEDIEGASTLSIKAARNVEWVIKTLAGLVVAGFIAGGYVTSLAQDVEANKTELEKREEAIEAVPLLISTLVRIEKKIDAQAVEQKTISETVIRLETKVEVLEEKVE